MTPPTTALPCPFCGNPPELTHMPIELYNGCIPTRERPAWMIRCAILFCLGPSAHSETSEADAIEKWNRRAPAVQATADADEVVTALAKEIILTFVTATGGGFYQAGVESVIRKHLRRAVSPKAADDALLKDAAMIIKRLAANIGDSITKGQAIDWLQRNGLQGSPLRSPAAVSGDKQEKER